MESLFGSLVNQQGGCKILCSHIFYDFDVYRIYDPKLMSEFYLHGVQNGHYSGLLWTRLISTFTKSLRMKHLTILVPEGENNLSSIVGAYKIFTRANQYWKESGKRESLKIELAGISKKVEFYDGLFTVKPHTH